MRVITPINFEISFNILYINIYLYLSHENSYTLFKCGNANTPSHLLKYEEPMYI